MNSTRISLKQWLRLVPASIAFYPTLIALALIICALLLIWAEYQPWLMTLKDRLDVVLVDSVEDGRLILGTLVASTISLMVFSFSMVMLVLNQASANLSPRLLPGLITVKDNQIVLGFYLGTICYCLMLILNIHPDAENAAVPGFGIFIGMCLGLFCLGLFTYFIHSISQAIQVDNILDRLFRQTWSRLDKDHTDQPMPEPAEAQWYELQSPEAGYLKWIQEEELLALCAELDLQLKMAARVGAFFIADAPYLEVTRDLEEGEREKIHRCFVFYPQERLGDHFAFGFKQISEIAVKALSPGINDPATAIKAIDMLVMLTIHKCGCYERTVLSDRQDRPRIFLKPTTVDDLLHQNFTPIRAYASQDPSVLHHLLAGLKKIGRSARDDLDRQATLAHIVAVRDSCDRTVLNPLDRESINRLIEVVNRQLEGADVALLA